MLDQATRQLLDEVAAATRVGHPERVELGQHYVDIAALFDRCRSAMGAIRLLSERGFGQEALALSRSVFTESLMLMELARSDEVRRVELVIGWFLATWDNVEGMMEEARAQGQDGVDEQIAAIESRKTAAAAYAARHGATVRRWRVDEKALALAHERRDEYLAFRFTSHFVHGTTIAGTQRYSTEGDGVMVGGPAADPSWGKPAALFAAASVLDATEAATTLLGVRPTGIDIPKLRARLEQGREELLEEPRDF